MTTEKILYTDGHEVIVTDSFFKVKKSSYQLNGITKHRLFIIYPDRLIPFLVLAIGALMVTLGILRMIPNNFMPEVEFYSIQLNANIAALGLGGVLVFVGCVVIGLMKERYAIRIATAEGEKNVVVSNKREYIAQILDALNHAFFNLITSTQERAKRVIKK